MAVRSRDEYLEALRARIGEDTSDDAISLLEDFTDTYDSIVSAQGEDWKMRYEENDALWRKRYTDRFGGGTDGSTTYVTTEATEKADPSKETEPEIEFDDLFE